MADEDRNLLTALDGLDDSRRALLNLLGDMRRSLRWYAPGVRADLYNDAEVLAALRNRVVNQPKLRLQLLLPPAREWRSDCPGLAQLCERLTSALQLRALHRQDLPDQPELGQAFVIADERSLLRWSDPRRLIGVYQPQPSERMKERLELFDRLWSHAPPDADLQHLGL